MSAELAIYNAAPEERWRYCQALAEASLLPDSYKRQPANLLLALESGAALGVAPMVAIQEIHVIKGKPSPSAQLQAALVRRAGHTLRITATDTSAVCEIIRADDPGFTFRTEWTLERAKQAGLLSNDMWRKYPRNMLKARAISECARDACPDVIVGFGYTREELGDETDAADAIPTTVEVVPETDDGAAPLAESPSETGARVGSIPADSPAPSSDITDAEIVDEATGEITPDALAAQASAAERVAASRTLHEPSAAPTDAAFRALQAGLSAYAKAHGIDRAEVITRVAHVVGRDVESTKDLSAAEVSLLLNRLPRKAAA